MNSKHAILAGFLIGLGVWINIQAPNPVLGAFLFSLGLLSIIELQLPLFTGKIGFIIHQHNTKEMIKMLGYNLYGTIIFLSLVFLSGREPVLDNLEAAAAAKFSKDFLTLFIDGTFCGALIHLAARCKKPIITVMCVMIFILTGIQHCIADFPYFLMEWSTVNIIKYLCIVTGNAFGAIFIEKFLSEGESI